MPAEVTVAIELSLLLHAPPVTASLKVIVEDSHTVVVPVIEPAFGNGLTVTAVVATAVPQLLVTEYDTFTLPAATPVTIPAELTVAIELLLLLHTPPVVASFNVVVADGQTVVVPVIVPAPGNGLTVTAAEVVAVPQLLVTA